MCRVGAVCATSRCPDSVVRVRSGRTRQRSAAARWDAWVSLPSAEVDPRKGERLDLCESSCSNGWMQTGSGEPEASLAWPADLYDVLRTALVSFRHCRHRVPLDAVDEAYDAVIDRFLDGASIKSLGRYAREVLRRRIARGPLRLGARRDGHRSIEACCLADSLESTSTSMDIETRRRQLRGLLSECPVGCPCPSPGEVSAVRAVADGGAIRDVASRLGCSERSLRMRLDRAARKLRYRVETRAPRQ